jgi:hypothetical protein
MTAYSFKRQFVEPILEGTKGVAKRLWAWLMNQYTPIPTATAVLLWTIILICSASGWALLYFKFSHL